MGRLKTDGNYSTNARIPPAEEPLHIGFYSPALPDSGITNGIVTYTGIMRDALRALGHRVTVVTASHIEHSDGRVAEVPKQNHIIRRLRLIAERSQPADGSDAWVRVNILQAFRAARRCRLDVFEIEESFGWAGRMVGRGIPIVERLHGPHTFVRNSVESSVEKRLGDQRVASEVAALAKVDAVTSASYWLLNAMINRYNLQLRQTSVYPNPIPVASPSAIWKLESADPNQFLFVGRFDLCKGADIAVRAFDRALTRKPALKLIIAGPDNGLAQVDGSKIHFDEFVRREVSPDARARIKFIGPQSSSEIAELRLRSGIALVASRFETFAYTIAEAMAVGMPILTSGTLAARELIRDGLDGRILPIADIDALATAMLEMASSPAGLGQFGRSAQVRANRILAPDRIALEAEDLYRRAIVG